MPTFEKTIEVKGKKTDVWEVLTDLERYKDRTVGVTEVLITSERKKGVGVTFQESGMVFGERFEANTVITNWVDEEKITQQSSSPAGTTTTSTIELESTEHDEKTRVTYRVTYQLPAEYDTSEVQQSLSRFFESSVKQLQGFLEKD